MMDNTAMPIAYISLAKLFSTLLGRIHRQRMESDAANRKSTDQKTFFIRMMVLARLALKDGFGGANRTC